MFRVLAPHFAHAFLTRYSNSSRSVSPDRLADLLRANGDLPATLCPTSGGRLPRRPRRRRRRTM